MNWRARVEAAEKRAERLAEALRTVINGPESHKPLHERKAVLLKAFNALAPADCGGSEKEEER